MKFEDKINEILETVEDALKVMKDAEVDIAYYIPDPKKDHPSAIDGKLYVKRKDAEKVAKKLGLDFEVWTGLHKGGIGKYGAPKKYKIVK